MDLTHEDFAKILARIDKPKGFDPKLLTTIEFSGFWKLLREKLKELTLIKNWTADKGYYGEDFEANSVPVNEVVRCYLPNKREPIKLERNEFKFVFDKWNDYINGIIKRAEFSKIRTSKYVISIIHHIIAVAAE